MSERYLIFPLHFPYLHQPLELLSVFRIQLGLNLADVRFQYFPIRRVHTLPVLQFFSCCPKAARRIC